MSNIISIVEAEEWHIDALAGKLRTGDVREIWAAAHMTSYDALRHSFNASSGMCWAGFEGDEIIAMFGAGRGSALSNKGSPWLLGSPELTKNLMPCQRLIKLYLSVMLDEFEVLENYIDARNVKVVKWLKWLGFQTEEPKPYGPENKPFIKFTLRRYRLCV